MEGILTNIEFNPDCAWLNYCLYLYYDMEFDSIINYPFLVRQLDTGSKILRVRAHSKDNQEFKHIHELSYPPNDRVGLMRANLKGEPMFYGSVFSIIDDRIDSPRMTCLFETTSIVTDDTFVGKRAFTYSVWVTDRPLNLFIIPTFEENTHEEFAWFFSLWKSLITEFGLTEEQVNELRKLSEKFSFTSESEDEKYSCYRYTATFTKQLLYANPEIDGIMYPSVKLKDIKMGINIAIKPEVADSALNFKSCSICHLFKRSKKQQTLLFFKHSRLRGNRKLYYVPDTSYYNDIKYLSEKDPTYEIGKLKFEY